MEKVQCAIELVTAYADAIDPIGTDTDEEVFCEILDEYLVAPLEFRHGVVIALLSIIDGFLESYDEDKYSLIQGIAREMLAVAAPTDTSAN